MSEWLDASLVAPTRTGYTFAGWTGSGIEGQPITWQQDGVQYIAVNSGYGGVYSLFSGDERLAKVPPGGSLWVFAVKN